MLSVAQDLQNLIAPYQTAINDALSVATSLPLVGHQLSGLQDLSTLLQNSLQSIETTVQNVDSGHFQFAIPLPGISHTFTFNLGLDAFLKVSTSGGVTAAINPVLNVGFDVQDGDVSLDAAQTNLDIGFSLSLPDFQATASLNGVLFTKVVDQGTNFDGHLLFGFDSDGSISPQFSGDAHIRFGLTMSFVDPSLNVSFNPTFLAQLQLDWGIDSTTNQLKAPTIALKDFSLDADSFTHNFVGDIVTSVQKYTKPLEPFLDMLDQPVPILSAFDSSETMGDLFLGNLTPAQKDQFDLMVRVLKAVNTFSLTGSTGGAVIDFGSITLTGDAQQAGGFGFDTSQLGNAIDTIFNSPALHEVENVLQEVASYAGDDAEGGFTFPLLETPGQVIGGILTGQTETMFAFSTGRQHFELAPSIGFGIKDLFGVFLSAGIIFDADLTMGYDTGGLNKLIQDPNHDPVDLLHGFYFDNSIDTTDAPVPNVPSPRKTAVYLQGFARIDESAVVTFTGGLFANISVELANTDASPHVALDSMINNLGSGNKVFHASGELYASASLELTLDTEVGPSITLFSYQLAKDVLLGYDPPPAPQSTIPTVVIDVTDQHTIELDPSKMSVGSSVSIEPFEDVTVTSGGNTFVADGIQVDYFNEIDLYIERKNNDTTNYYNLIGVNGVVPDGEYINITDPFRLFDDEGVPNPAPAQTTPGVILAGGSNVVYQYSDASDGSHATVLLAGGYGYSTLSGGTMEFGNFIPADRVNQALQHFGDTSGYDAAGVALIHSSINSDLAPADPAGVVGSTMTASRGGLMLGGAGNNSFIAAGPGAYDMVGGAWLNTFNITPSFDGVPATYNVDGGPFGQSLLVVRVPADEHVTLENSTIPDKYNAALRALAVDGNAGLSATVHGIQFVHIVGSSGSHVTIGDTSLVNIAFSISGGAHLTFGGTDAPDIFNVLTSGSFYDGLGHVTVPKYSPTPDGIQLPAIYGIGLPSRLPDPVYSITRTFGTNNVTQTIPFTIEDEEGSSVDLDAGGASDTYTITMGVGAFIDVSVDDSDSTTQNQLTVNVRDGNLVNNIATLTDSALHLDYYTDVDFEDALPQIVTGLSYYYSDFSSSVHYTPTVSFGSNEDITFGTAFPFIQTIVNRPTATQNASIVVDGNSYLSSIPYADLGPEQYVFDASTNPYTMFDPRFASRSIDVQANAGPLSISMSGVNQSLTTDIDDNSGQLSLSISHSFGPLDTFNVRSNSGTATIDAYIADGTITALSHVINVYANSGTLNIKGGRFQQFSTTDTQINIGLTHGLDVVQGTINFPSTGLIIPPTSDIVIDDRNGSSNSNWTLEQTELQIGGLAITGTDHVWPATTMETYWRASSQVTLIDNPPIYDISYNGSSIFPIAWYTPVPQQNHEEDAVSLSLANFFIQPGGAVTYSATNLPPGLSLDSSTGLISGTIQLGASLNSPYDTVYTVHMGNISYVYDQVSWIVNGTIDLEPGFNSPLDDDEGSRIDLSFYVSNSVNRPVTITAPGLPSWLTLDPNTDDIYGTPPVGAASAGPYHFDIHASDGVSSSDLPVDLSVSGVKFAPLAPIRYNLTGDSVDFTVAATTSTNRPLTFDAFNLPQGLSINPTTGEITGTISNLSLPKSSQVSVDVSDGLSTQSAIFTWNVVPPSYTDVLTLPSPGPQMNQVHESPFLRIPGYSSLLLILHYSVQGLPAGFSMDNYGDLGGSFAPGDVQSSPYHVTVTISDGLNTTSAHFDWYATAAGPITIPNPSTQTNNVGQFVDVEFNASTTSGLPLTYSATGLPNGLSIDPQTGAITGRPGILSAMPGYFNPEITVTDGVSTAHTMFQWTIHTLASPNVVSLALPDGGTIELDSASGTVLTAAVQLSSDAGPPGSIQFPFGFVTFSVEANYYQGVTTPISTTSLTMTITGPSSSQINNDYQYGPTPANASPHWYSFLYNHQTDSDDATGTGMESVGGGHFILILNDAGRGDDDRTINGVISGMGGLAITTTGTDPYQVTNTNDSGSGSLRQAIINANAAPGVVHTITFALPSGPQTINLQSPLPATADPLIAVADATQNVAIVASSASDSYPTFVKSGDGSLSLRDVSHVGGTIQVSAGLLQLDGSATPSFGSGTSASVTGSGTLELAGSVSDLTSGENITNNSTAAAGILVSGMNQVVGAISGNGNLALADGSNLTANSIVQNTLVIGAGATLTIAPSGGAPSSNAMGNSMAAAASATDVAATSSFSPVAAAGLAAVRAQRLAALLLAESSVSTDSATSSIDTAPIAVADTSDAITPAPTIASAVDILPSTTPIATGVQETGVQAASCPATSVQTTAIQETAIQAAAFPATFIPPTTAPTNRNPATAVVFNAVLSETAASAPPLPEPQASRSDAVVVASPPDQLAFDPWFTQTASDLGSSPSIEASNWQNVSDLPKASIPTSSTTFAGNGFNSNNSPSPRSSHGIGVLDQNAIREAIDATFAGDDDFSLRDDSLLALLAADACNPN